MGRTHDFPCIHYVQISCICACPTAVCASLIRKSAGPPDPFFFVSGGVVAGVVVVGVVRRMGGVWGVAVLSVLRREGEFEGGAAEVGRCAGGDTAALE